MDLDFETAEHRKQLAPGDSLRLGFSYAGRNPDGVSKNGGYNMEFITASSIVLTGFSGVTFVPAVGFFPDDAIEDGKNNSDPREWPEDWWKARNRAAIVSSASSHEMRSHLPEPRGPTRRIGCFSRSGW